MLLSAYVITNFFGWDCTNYHCPITIDGAVYATAVRILAKMKGIWMSGKDPSDLYGVALYTAAIYHNFDYSISQIAELVKVDKDTLTQLITEFEKTVCGSLPGTEDEAEQNEAEQSSDQNMFIGEEEEEDEEEGELGFFVVEEVEEEEEDLLN